MKSLWKLTCGNKEQVDRRSSKVSTSNKQVACAERVGRIERRYETKVPVHSSLQRESSSCSCWGSPAEQTNKRTRFRFGSNDERWYETKVPFHSSLLTTVRDESTGSFERQDRHKKKKYIVVLVFRLQQVKFGTSRSKASEEELAGATILITSTANTTRLSAI